MLTVNLILEGLSVSFKPSSLVTFPVFISASSKIGKVCATFLKKCNLTLKSTVLSTFSDLLLFSQGHVIRNEAVMQLPFADSSLAGPLFLF